MIPSNQLSFHQLPPFLHPSNFYYTPLPKSIKCPSRRADFASTKFGQAHPLFPLQKKICDIIIPLVPSIHRHSAPRICLLASSLPFPIFLSFPRRHQRLFPYSAQTCFYQQLCCVKMFPFVAKTIHFCVCRVVLGSPLFFILSSGHFRDQSFVIRLSLSACCLAKMDCSSPPNSRSIQPISPQQWATPLSPNKDHPRPSSLSPPPSPHQQFPSASLHALLFDYRGEKVAGFELGPFKQMYESRLEMGKAKTIRLCLPQVYELFLKQFVGGLHTVYTKLKRLGIHPTICNVEQVRALRSVGAIQPGVNRCKLIGTEDFETLYSDCTSVGARPGRPAKRTSSGTFDPMDGTNQQSTAASSSTSSIYGGVHPPPLSASFPLPPPFCASLSALLLPPFLNNHSQLPPFPADPIASDGSQLISAQQLLRSIQCAAAMATAAAATNAISQQNNQLEKDGEVEERRKMKTKESLVEEDEEVEEKRKKARTEAEEERELSMECLRGGRDGSDGSGTSSASIGYFGAEEESGGRSGGEALEMAQKRNENGNGVRELSTTDRGRAAEPCSSSPMLVSSSSSGSRHSSAFTNDGSDGSANGTKCGGGGGRGDIWGEQQGSGTKGDGTESPQRTESPPFSIDSSMGTKANKHRQSHFDNISHLLGRLNGVVDRVEDVLRAHCDQLSALTTTLQNETICCCREDNGQQQQRAKWKRSKSVGKRTKE